jgi:hypothetical protein
MSRYGEQGEIEMPAAMGEAEETEPGPVVEDDATRA